ncbi:MAG: alpha-ketoacid dehydrogenase subunit beta [Gammaproteobacteria bacterium]|uniref:2-oxoisovalerate dehydrogenase subunit beta n=1 Tax=Marinobacter litoralis TaxID=187981 RepID=A0A3M2RK21_9GAMM|nr:alpha-ketoacid dehydrogenase subunit beta [Marinobacter litoralis]MBR9869856.1 alpha-ketoacid dehydrogenase subunit beta [Gammaproteobacteria bacterium]RMJ05574.1 Pyruvate dehydrogenase E1 component subunit beta [Marinobacter litoralis]
MKQSDVRDVTLVEAVNMALHWEMAQDENVVVLGEDIATNGGVFRATLGLKDAFGFKRVMDTPLAENLIAGTAIGMSTQGLKPVAEFQFMGFIYPAMEQIVCHASRMRNRTRGRLHCPLVFRAPFGGGIHAPEHHSESTEALFAHIPGLRVVIPSSPQRAYGLLLAAIRDPDPVIFLEPKRIYRAVTQSVQNNGEALPLDTCFTLREGDDVTLITWGACVMETLKAADKLAEQGVGCEVIDVATISPLDRETLLCSVAKTGRAVIVHEACRNGGVGAEIAASIAESAFLDLQAPVIRVTGYDTVMPYYRNEQNYLPQMEDIVHAVEQVIGL